MNVKYGVETPYGSNSGYQEIDLPPDLIDLRV